MFRPLTLALLGIFFCLHRFCLFLPLALTGEPVTVNAPQEKM
jgi:hypothetical protein